MRDYRILLTVIGILLALANCAGGNSANGADISSELADLTALRSDPVELIERYEAVADEVEACMADSGFTLVSHRIPTIDELTGRDLRPAIPGYYLRELSLDDAAATGFGYAQLRTDRQEYDSFSEEEISANQLFGELDLDGDPSIFNDEEAQYSAALWGFEDQAGCYDQAIVELGPVSAAQLELIVGEDRLDEAGARFLADADLLSASSSWAACMMESGYVVPATPWDVNDVVGAVIGVIPEDDGAIPDIATDREIEIAVAYVECLEPVRPDIEAVWERHF